MFDRRHAGSERIRLMQDSRCRNARLPGQHYGDQQQGKKDRNPGEDATTQHRHGRS